MLIAGGEALVRGAVALGRAMRVPSLLVGLTVVAFGTSAPELVVSINAVIRDAAGVAYGNIVGSNIANVGLALSLPALIHPVQPPQKGAARSATAMLVSSLIFAAFMLFTGGVTGVSGAILIAGLIVYLAVLWRDARSGDAPPELAELEDDAPADHGPRLKMAGYLLFGLVALPLGSDWLVTAAINLASDVGVSDEVIGLTAVAVGTSLPEIATVTASALKRESGLTLGNVMGSNIFNVLAVGGGLGVAAQAAGKTASTPLGFQWDLGAMLAMVALCAVAVYVRRPLGRVVGVSLLALFCVYVVSVGIRSFSA